MSDKFGCLDLSRYEARGDDDEDYGPWSKESDTPNKNPKRVDPEAEGCGRHPDDCHHVVDIEGEIPRDD